jgi:uncharacterized protein YlaI
MGADHLQCREGDPAVQLRCVLCDRVVEVPDEDRLAKRARHDGPAFAYLCRDCDLRLAERYGARPERANPLLRGGRRPGRC